MKKFKKVAVGGTFDELHKGHKVLLLKAFEIGEQILIGLCTDEFAEKMGKPHITARFDERLKELLLFLKNHKLYSKAKIIPLNDAFGNTTTDKSIEALVVSEETKKIALKINKKRIEIGFPPLEIIMVHMVPAENYKPISTTRIREGEIDREGHILRKI
ncbi:MAG: pantetheine-phosphate adenylyltransferase [Candidatus Bathyarchaeota archaeon]|nr:pantetheine-phosphate adenylyltransferase [Candidatus Bathyarchaeota archaeon]